MYMASLFTRAEIAFLESVSRIAYGNPFLPELIDWERKALGSEYQPRPQHWSLDVENPEERRTNSWRIAAKVDTLLDTVPLRMRRGAQPMDHELVLYEDAALFALYHRMHDQLFETAIVRKDGKTPYYRAFLESWRERIVRSEFTLPSGHEPRHTWACFFQIVRAFHHIFNSIVGASATAARLREAIWQSVFTHDIRRYRRCFYARMGEFATLITGRSGTGKELVARSISLSRYIPFDERSMSFGEDLSGHFHPIHIGSLTNTLVESELFGHKRGSFTGAINDRRGWLEACPQLGAVFLDEIGELSGEMQMKLLRVIETRQFTPVGDTAPKRFEGKLIAATHRNLPAMIADGNFREDLYYRLCSDLIETPSLADQVRESPSVLRDLVFYLARRNAGDEAQSLADEAYEWIVANLGENYDWPGNYRELEQCVRNLIIRREYRPVRRIARERESPFDAAVRGEITAEELVRRYCRLVYSQTGSYEETARRIGLDRRTVKAKIEAQ